MSEGKFVGSDLDAYWVPPGASKTLEDALAKAHAAKVSKWVEHVTLLLPGHLAQKYPQDPPKVVEVGLDYFMFERGGKRYVQHLPTVVVGGRQEPDFGEFPEEVEG